MSSANLERSGARVAGVRGRARVDRVDLSPVVLAGIVLVTLIVVLRFGRQTGFYYDDWNFVLERRAWSLDALLLPHNEHLSVVPVLTWKLVFETVGIDDYWVLRLLLALAHVGVLVGLYAYARPRVGGVLACAAAGVLALFGPGWWDLLWAFQIGFTGSLAAGVGVLLALDRRTRTGDLLAAGLLTVALGSSSLGLPILAGAVVELIGGPERRRRWWVVAVPLVLYAVWYLTYGVGGNVTLDKVLAVPGYVAQGIAGTSAAVFGLNGLEWGRPLAVAVVGLLIWSARRYVAIPWRLAGLLTIPLTFWALAAAARADQLGPETPRYLYPAAVFLVLVAIETARDRPRDRRLVVLVAVLVLASVVTNLQGLRQGGRTLRAFAGATDGALGAMEVAGDRIAPGVAVRGDVSPQLLAGTYRAAVADYGPIVGGEAGILKLPESGRQLADGTLIVSYPVALAPRPVPVVDFPRPAPTPEAAETASVRTTGRCVIATPQAAEGALRFVVPAAGLIVYAQPGATVTMRRWADAFGPRTLPIDSADPRLLKIEPDAARAPWRARIASAAPIRVCGAGG